MLFTRGGGLIFALGGSENLWDGYEWNMHAGPSSTARARLAAGDTWGAAMLATYPFKTFIRNMHYGDLSIRANAGSGTNQVPAVTLSASSTRILTGQSVTFNATVSDPDASTSDGPDQPFEHQVEWFLQGYDSGRATPTAVSDDRQSGWLTRTFTYNQPGTYVARVEVMDEWMARGWKEVTILVEDPDLAPPTQPGGLTTVAQESGWVDLSWTASTDNVSVSGYEIKRNGTVIVPSQTGTTYSDTALSPSTLYTYEVVALDPTGNRSPVAQTSLTTPPAEATVNLTAAADARINVANPDTNYGIETTSFITYRTGDSNLQSDVVLRFDLTGVDKSKIQTARLKLSCTGDNNENVILNVNLVPEADANENFGETAVTWNNAPASGTLLGTITNDRARPKPAIYTVNTSALLTAVTSDTDNILTVRLHMTNIRDGWIMATRENTNTAIRPTLTLFAPPPAGYTITQSIGANGAASDPGSPMTVAAGGTSTITYTANPWFRIASLTINGAPVAAAVDASSYTNTLTNVAANHAVQVTFKAASAAQSGIPAAVDPAWARNYYTTEAAAAADANLATDYLYGLDPRAAYDLGFAVASFVFDGSNATIVAQLKNGSVPLSTTTHGTLKIQGKASLSDASWTDIAATAVSNASFDGNGAHSLSFAAATFHFFRAVLTP